jgi:hypothetical protein
LVQFLTTLFDRAEKLTPDEVDKIMAYSGELRRRENLERRSSIYSPEPEAVEQAELPKSSGVKGLLQHHRNLEREASKRLWESMQKQAEEFRLRFELLEPTDPSLSKLTDSELVANLKNLDPWIIVFDRSPIEPRGDMQAPIKDIFQVQSKKKLFLD